MKKVEFGIGKDKFVKFGDEIYNSIENKNNKLINEPMKWNKILNTDRGWLMVRKYTFAKYIKLDQNETKFN